MKSNDEETTQFKPELNKEEWAGIAGGFNMSGHVLEPA